jgi:hypothetical protein
MPEDHANAEPGQDPRLFTKSDEWIARWLGGDLQIAMVRLFGGMVAVLVIGATLARFASR